MSAGATGTDSPFAVLRRFGSVHAHWLYRGLVATVAWVACRLAMPWPLKGVIEAAFPDGDAAGASTRFVPSGWDPVLVLVAAYVLLLIAFGLTERWQRALMTRFSTGTVEDLRSAAQRGAGQAGNASLPGGHGELIARLVGDAAHLRRDLYGILVHASKNTLLFGAICALLLVLSPEMGAFFLVGGLLATVVGYRAAHTVAKRARRQRANDGTYAATLELALAQGSLAVLDADDDDADERDGPSFGDLAESNLLIHLLLALTVGAALLTGIHQVRAGQLSPGGLFLFVAYALTVHRRLVQLGRQLARIGKVRVSIERISLLLPATTPSADGPSAPLSSELALDGIRVASARGHGDKPRLRPLDLSLRAGSRVAVLGAQGAGKSTLLRCLAGIEPTGTGSIRWDGVPLNGAPPVGLAYLAQDPIFAPDKVGRILGVRDDAALDEHRSTLQRVGAWNVIRRLPRGIADKVGSLTLSKQEARALGLAAVVLGDASLWVLDAPLEGLSRKAAQRRLGEVLDRADGRTLVVGLTRPHLHERFDRLLVLKRGKLKFDGTPTEWLAWRAERRAKAEALRCAG